MQLKFKMHITQLKWAATIFCLMFNIVYIAPGNDITFLIVYGLIVNGMAVATFILLSIFPKDFYVLNENGISFYNGRGKEKKFISWGIINKIFFSYAGGYPEGMQVTYHEDCEDKNFLVGISEKQYLQVLDTFRSILEEKKIEF